MAAMSESKCPYKLDAIERKGTLLEYSVIYTDRAFNLMSDPFKQAMCDISRVLKSVYKANSIALIPGSGTYAMEAVARQFVTGKKAMVIRNGYFSYRWSDIFNVCKIPSEEIVLKARMVDESEELPQFAPVPIAEVIRGHRHIFSNSLYQIEVP